MKIEESIKQNMNKGLKYNYALAKTCQDILLSKISKSGFTKHATIKGGVVMMNLSKNDRRATRDLDLDFIRYSLEDISVKLFIEKLNNTDDNIKLEIVKPIETMKHEDYKGKRIYLEFIDETAKRYEFKLDIGVHKNLELEQEEVCFDLNNSLESVTLLANSKEQIISEKLKSLLKIGIRSTRYKDIFDIYYLTTINKADTEKLKKLLNNYILEDDNLNFKTFESIYERLRSIFNNRIYKQRIKSKEDDNWLKLPLDDVLDTVLEFFKNL